MYKVGLTGGIGSGKSTVSRLFKSYHVPIIDADEIAHSLVAPGKKALTLICDYFGDICITEGHLNRTILRNIIFNNEEKKHHLEGIMHPLIYREIEQQVSQLTEPYCIIEIPLLIETKMQSLVDHILVIDCSREIQMNRVKSRDSLSDSQITNIIRSQSSRTDRLNYANSIINNTQDINFLYQQVHNLHTKFTKQSK